MISGVVAMVFRALRLHQPLWLRMDIPTTFRS